MLDVTFLYLIPMIQGLRPTAEQGPHNRKAKGQGTRRKSLSLSLSFLYFSIFYIFLFLFPWLLLFFLQAKAKAANNARPLRQHTSHHGTLKATTYTKSIKKKQWKSKTRCKLRRLLGSAAGGNQLLLLSWSLLLLWLRLRLRLRLLLLPFYFVCCCCCCGC